MAPLKNRTTSSALDPVTSNELLAACDQIVSPSLLAGAISRVGWRHRGRILRPVGMLVGLMRMVAMAMPSLLQLVDTMRREGIQANEPFASAAAFYKRLKVMPHELHLAVLQDATAVVAASKLEREGIRTLAPWAREMYSVDDTTLDALARKTSALQAFPKGAMETLAGRIACAVDLRTGLVAEALYNPDAKANEKPHFGALLDVLGTNNLFVFDLGYFSFPLFDRLTASGNFFVTRMREKTSFTTVVEGVQTAHYKESLVYLGAHRADQASHPVRLIEILITKKWHRYITNVLEPSKLSADAVWKLYKERWGIEQIFAVLKQSLKLAFIHPCHTNGVLSQVWATLTVYQVLQNLRLKAAQAHGCGTDDISWYNLMQRIGWYAREQSKLSLTDWLMDTSAPLFLEKRGQRLRVPKELVGRLAKDLALPPVAWISPPPRKARHGKPEPAPDLSKTQRARLKP